MNLVRFHGRPMLRKMRKLAGRIPGLKSLRALVGRVYIRRALRTIAADPKRLEHYGFRVYSQNDEDGIIAHIFHVIGMANMSFIECGAGDGTENNTRKLLNEGWHGLWIDGDRQNVEIIRTTMDRQISAGQLSVTCAFITRENINDLILAAGFSGEVDLLSIDIDGNDAHVWRAISAVKPRVVCIEYNAFHRPPIEWTSDYDPDFRWDGHIGSSGASLKLLERIGNEKGYALVGCNITGVNAFFVRRDLGNERFSAPFTAEHHFRRWLMASIPHVSTEPAGVSAPGV